MSFDRINQFLKHFYSFTPTESAVKEFVIESVKEVCGITLRKQNIEFRKNFIYLRSSSIQKSEIILHKQEILELLRRKTEMVRDIR